MAEDLDLLPDSPYHVELIDGALVFMMSPQRAWHSWTIKRLAAALEGSAPEGMRVEDRMMVRLDDRNRVEPDIVVVTAPADPNRTCYDAAEVVLVVEVVSPESAHRDRNVKIVKYAQAGIAHYWRVEDEPSADGRPHPVVHRYQLDHSTSLYAPVGIDAGAFSCAAPFPIEVDLQR